MNSRKTSISQLMNDSSAATSSSDHHLSSNSGHSLRNLLSDDGPAQQHASLQQQQYHPSANNNSGLSNGVYGAYSSEQERNYYSHVQQQQQPQPVHNQPLPSLEQNNRPSFINNDVSADADEASKSLILLSQLPPHYGLSRDHYSSKDNGQQISDVELAATAISSLSHSSDDTKSIHPQINQKAKPKNSMAISSLISGDESTSSDPAQSMQTVPTSTDTMPRYYQHPHDPYPDETRNGDIPSHHHPNHQYQTQNQQNIEYTSYHANNNGTSKKSNKRPLNGSPHLPINTKVYSSKKSPQKRRPSDPNETSQRPKIHHRSPDQMPYPPSGQKYSELREHPTEDQKPSIYLPQQVGPTNSADWEHQMPPQQFHQSRSLHNGPPADHSVRFQQKNCGSPPMPGDKSINIKNHFIIPQNERPLKKPSPPPINAPNGYVPGVGVGGMVGNPPITQSIPQQNGQMRPQTSIPSNNANFCRMYNEMQKHNIKKKRNAMHAYISYMIYTTSLQDNGNDRKDYISPPNNMIPPNRPSILSDNSPPMNNENGLVNPSMIHHHHTMNGTGMHPPRVDHPGYPPLQPLQPNNPGYIHPEANPSSVPPRRVSDSTMYSQPSPSARGYPPHGPPVQEPQPPHTSHRPIGSHRTSPSLLPNNHIQQQSHSIRHNQSMPNIHPDPQHRTPPSPLSRSGSGPPSHLYNGKSSPVPPPLIPPQSPAMNHYHSSQQGLVSQQNGSRLPPVGSHHHNSQPPELVGPSNSEILRQPLTSFLRDQPTGYGSAHPHNIQPNGVGPVGPPSHVGPPLSSGQRSGPNGYY
ncbi:8411_t:CDS:10 [Racocetra persica]|uniref:8411_t:CDS:1 n=1 Tax=Racocetra persica TaxID=160502 RepID=A0ACA9KJ67_9GLOM|nr:8411_t:CDS:10 [Racocetra persica]